MARRKHRGGSGPRSGKSTLTPFSGGRRRFLQGVAATTGAALIGGCGSSDGGFLPEDAPPLPEPRASGIDHIVVVMMENRSFDHYLGWVPGADGIQRQTFRHRDNSVVQTYDLGAMGNYQGCGLADPNHGYEGGRTQLNGGRMDGWLLTDPTQVGDNFPAGYYSESALPFFSGAARHFTIGDRYFTGLLASTFPNRVYMHAGATDRLTNTFDISSLPTIWQRLAAGGISHGYYFNDLPVTALWGEQHLAISRPYATFALDAAAGILPQVAFVDPRFLLESPNGVSNDDHPNADIRNGQAFLNNIYNALRNGPLWDRTLLIINYDEWGGFFDHVVPPVGPVSEAEATINDGTLGFRVPFAMLGPRVRRGHVTHQQLDPNSILNFITWRFGLQPLSARAQWSGNLAHSLDFVSPPNLDAPDFGVAPGPFGVDCTTGLPIVTPNRMVGTDSHEAEWEGLRLLARRHGFAV